MFKYVILVMFAKTTLRFFIQLTTTNAKLYENNLIVTIVYLESDMFEIINYLDIILLKVYLYADKYISKTI